MNRAATWFVAASFGWLAVASGATAPEKDVLMRAMQDELERSMRELKLERMAAPYFLAYRIDDIESMFTAAVFGALTHSSENRHRALTVEMRIGSPELDNTNFLPTRWWSSPLTRRIPLPQDDDYRELRRQIWLATDRAYKHALETLAQKRAALQNRSREDVPDFAAEEPHVSRDELSAEPPEAAAVGELVRNLAAAFRDMPHVDDSFVAADIANRRSHYLNSEGTSYVQTQSSVEVQVVAKTQAADGTVLQDSEVVHERTWQELPNEEALLRRVHTMGDSLAARRQAEFVTRYSGPVLFAGQAAAVLVAQALVPRLLAVRVPIAAERMDNSAESSRNPFQDKIGARVLPRFLHVYDDPTLESNAAGRLYGGYAVDGDGLPATPTTLVERGVLKTLLSSRNPSADVPRSTGNQRGGHLLPSNLLVTSERGMTATELRRELAMLVAERGNDYGIVVERIANGLKLDYTDNPSYAPGAIRLGHLTRLYKVYADGREEPIRKAELSAFSESAFRDIVGVSESVTNYTTGPLPWMTQTAMMLSEASARYGGVPLTGTTVSISVPDLLFEEVTLRKPPGNVPRPPLAAHPYFAGEE